MPSRGNEMANRTNLLRCMSPEMVHQADMPQWLLYVRCWVLDRQVDAIGTPYRTLPIFKRSI
jgi:hypothetical protein